MATRDKYSLNAAGIPLITAYNGSFYLLVGKVGGCFLMCIYIYLQTQTFSWHFESNGADESFVVPIIIDRNRWKLLDREYV